VRNPRLLSRTFVWRLSAGDSSPRSAPLGRPPARNDSGLLERPRHLIDHRPRGFAPGVAHEQARRGEIDRDVAWGELVDRLDRIAYLIHRRRLVILDFDRAAAERYGEIRAALESMGDQLRLLGHNVVSGNPDYGLRLLFLAINLILLFGSFQLVMRIALAKKVSFRDIWVGAAVATIGLFILQNLGGYIITHELKNLDNLYGTFAVVLGLLFWLYLQTQLIIYAMEIDAVRVLKLWPRSLL